MLRLGRAQRGVQAGCIVGRNLCWSEGCEHEAVHPPTDACRAHMRRDMLTRKTGPCLWARAARVCSKTPLGMVRVSPAIRRRRR